MIEIIISIYFIQSAQQIQITFVYQAGLALYLSVRIYTQIPPWIKWMVPFPADCIFNVIYAAIILSGFIGFNYMCSALLCCYTR